MLKIGPATVRSPRVEAAPQDNEQSEIEARLITVIGELNSLILGGGVCIWEDIQFNSIDQWHFNISEEEGSDEFCTALQFSNFAIRQFMEGVNALEVNEEEICQKRAQVHARAEDIIEHSVAIRLELLDYIHLKRQGVATELWIYELVNSLANLSGFLQAFERKNNPPTIKT